MKKYEYMKKAIRHEADDVVPFTIHLTGEGFNAYSDRLLKDYYNEEISEDLAKGKISKEHAVYLSIGNFMISAPFPWWGWDNEHMPAVYHDPDEVPTMMPPTNDGYGDENFTRCAEYTSYIREKYGTYMAALVWGSHWEKAYFTRGIENMLADFAGAPGFVQELLDFIIDKNMHYLDKLLTYPQYDGVLLGSDWGTQRDLIVSPKCWRDMIKPGEIREYDVIHASGKDVMIHSCGCILKVMPDLVDMGVEILNPVQPECMDLEFLKNEYGSHITYWGGISTQQVLPNGTPAEVAKETERVIKLMSRNGGYITAPSQEIQTDVPYENLRAMIDTARYYAGL